MGRDSSKHLVEFYPAAAVPTTGCAVPLCSITHNSVNVTFGFLVEEKKKKVNFFIACNDWFLHYLRVLEYHSVFKTWVMWFFTEVVVHLLYQLQPEYTDFGDPERSGPLLSQLIFVVCVFCFVWFWKHGFCGSSLWFCFSSHL